MTGGSTRSGPSPPSRSSTERTGSLEVAFDQRAANLLRASAAAAGPERCEWLNAADARLIEPALPAHIVGAVFAPAHGYVSAPDLTEALSQAVVRGGGHIESGARAISVETGANAVQVTLESGRVLRASRIVVASGSWTPQLRGLEDDAARQVRPVRGQLLRVRVRTPVLTRVVWGPGCYLVPWADGTVLVGATMEEAGFEERNTVAAVRTLLAAASTLVPALNDATFVDARAGLRPATSDGLPIIGPSATSDRVLYATGHFRNGILLAPLTGRLIADYLIEGRADSALDALRPRANRVGARVQGS